MRNAVSEGKKNAVQKCTQTWMWKVNLMKPFIGFIRPKQSKSQSIFRPHLKWWRMPLRARPSAQLVVKFSTLTSGYERVHWRTQLSKIFSLLVCCRLDMMSFMMSFTYRNMCTRKKGTSIWVNKRELKTCTPPHVDYISLLGFTHTAVAHKCNVSCVTLVLYGFCWYGKWKSFYWSSY